jgi:hypothetical protein
MAVDHQAMDDKVALRLHRSPGMIARGVFDHPNITKSPRSEHLEPQAFRVSLLQPIRFPTMSQVAGVFVATEAATIDIFDIGVDDFVLSHLAVPIISLTC